MFTIPSSPRCYGLQMSACLHRKAIARQATSCSTDIEQDPRVAAFTAVINGLPLFPNTIWAAMFPDCFHM